jgi:hypothetical protein
MRVCVRFVTDGLICYLILLGTGRAYGQAQLREETRTTTQVRRVSSVIGAAVQLQAGGEFGKVEDLVINEQGCIDFTVVVFEEKFIAVPFTLTRVDFARKVVVIDVERERLLRAPSFARTQFPDLSVSSEFGRRVHSHFGVQTERQPRQPRTPGTRPLERPVPEKRPVERPVPEKRKPPEKPSGQ